MALFYQGIAIILWYLGSTFASHTISDYTPPQFPVSVALALAAGPFEEAVFFGIPYYITNNHYVVLAFASMWSLVHIFSTHTISFTSLAYANFLLTIPHLFFSIRAWSSGKGWFAVIFHSAWNISILLTYCTIGIRECTLISTDNNLITDIMTIISATMAVLFVYQIYKSKTKKISKPLIIVILAGLVISAGILSFTNVNFLF